MQYSPHRLDGSGPTQFKNLNWKLHIGFTSRRATTTGQLDRSTPIIQFQEKLAEDKIVNMYFLVFKHSFSQF